MYLAPDSGPAIGGGVLAGMAGLAAFLVLHQLWIIPIWFILPVGTLVAGVAGAGVGASYATLRSHLPPRPWTSASLGAVVAAMMAPAIVIAEIRGPIFAMDADGGGRLLVPVADVALGFLVGLIGLTALSGAVVGALVGRTQRAAVATMLAGIVLALGPGHNIPLLAGTAVVGKELAILGATLAVSAVSLVEAEAWLRGRGVATGAQAVASGGGSLAGGPIVPPVVPFEMGGDE